MQTGPDCGSGGVAEESDEALQKLVQGQVAVGSVQQLVQLLAAHALFAGRAFVEQRHHVTGRPLRCLQLLLQRRVVVP